jgi:hypothetical protein
MRMECDPPAATPVASKAVRWSQPTAQFVSSGSSKPLL